MIRLSTATRVTALAVIGMCFATSGHAAAIHYTLDDRGTVNPYVQGFSYLNQFSPDFSPRGWHRAAFCAIG
jgi:hypothetical protein